MSASLVGSEMCIRDSPVAPPPPQWLGWLSGEVLQTGWSSPQRRPHAVSYTHLTLPTICSV
eukprot:3539883-Alexandrium_andersonii.AAC.1